MTSALSSWRFINHVIPLPGPLTQSSGLRRHPSLPLATRYDAPDKLTLRCIVKKIASQIVLRAVLVFANFYDNRVKKLRILQR